MYSACMYCHGALGANEVIEHFPVGRRLAFDEARGRLWVVCRKCERWNLTPLEERWEAIEECERAFRATKLRVSTDHIGLARVKEGLELVRIGDPLRPEMAAWRYGDQFGRRRRKHFLVGGGVAAAIGAAVIAGPVLGIVGTGVASGAWNLLLNGGNLYRNTRKYPVQLPGGKVAAATMNGMSAASLRIEDERIVLSLPVIGDTTLIARRWISYTGPNYVELHDDDALRAASGILPLINRKGGSRDDVQDALQQLDEEDGVHSLFAKAAVMAPERPAGQWHRQGRAPTRVTGALSRLPSSTRLALEMATHEETERRALEGELYLLEHAWKAAEEVAAIADDMFVPASVTEALDRLRGRR